MKVRLEPLANTTIRRMDVIDVRSADVHLGESVGYLCPHCLQADESRHQIWHDEDCRYAGEHGRAHYDDLEPDVPGRPTPELDADHRIDMVIAGTTHRGIGVYNEDVLGFRCQCGNLDEDLWEVVHDAGCDAADADHDPLTDPDAVPADHPVR